MEIRNKKEILGYPRQDGDRDKYEVGRGRSIFSDFISVYFRSWGFGGATYVVNGKCQC